MIRIVVCDDDVAAAENLCNRIYENTSDKYRPDVFTDAKQLRNAVESGNTYDIAILDIEMQDVSGMELVQIIRESNPDTLVLFVTDYLKYAVDSYELGVYRYIPKNELDTRFAPALESAIRKVQQKRQSIILTDTNNGVVHLLYEEIVSLRKDTKNIYVYPMGKEPVRIRESITNILAVLPDDMFAQIDRGVIINLHQVIAYTDDRVTMKDGSCFVVSRSHKSEVRKALQQAWRNSL